MEADVEKQWFIRHVKTIGAVLVNVFVLGAIYSTMRDDIRHLQEQAHALEAQKANEIGWRVGEHEKRLDGHDAALSKIGEAIANVNATLSRLDATMRRTGASLE